MPLRLLVVMIVLALSTPAETQQPKKIAHIGILALGFPPSPFAPSDVEAFYQGLREVGYTEGKNLIIEDRYAKGNSKRFPGLVAELVSSKVDLIVAPSTPAIQAAVQATTTIPIVIVSIADPVTDGIVDSLVRPGVFAFWRSPRQAS